MPPAVGMDIGGVRVAEKMRNSPRKCNNHLCQQTGTARQG